MKFTSALASSALLAQLALAQNAASSAASVVSGASSAVASASASASGNGTSGGGDYLTTVLGALTAAGLTSLVDVASAIANTTEGMALLGSLSQGNKTVFAPNNEAFSGVPESVTSNTTLLTEILSYHIVNSTLNTSSIAVSPNHTIVRTALRGGQFELPGNRTAPLVLEKTSSNATAFQIVQDQNINASNPASAANLQVYVIDNVLSLPGNLSTVATAAAPSAAGLIQAAGLLDALENARGITIFAPNDAAVAAVQAAVGSLNATQIQAVLANHVINGTVAYSSNLGSGNYTSAGGQRFTFSTNSTGTFVTSGTSTAQIVASDIILQNGVVHLINGVLVNTESNPGAAESAYTSATGAAATSTEPAGPVGTSQPAASSARPSGAAGRLEPLGLSGSMIGGAFGILLAVAGGAFTLF